MTRTDEPPRSHLTTEELLAMRDNEATGAARRHVEECSDCRRELESVFQVQARLRALPSLKPPRDRWPEIRAAAEAEARARSRRRWTAAVTLVAATVLLLIGGRAAVEQRAERLQRAALDAYLTDLREQSQLLDADLRAVESRSRVLSAWRAETIVGVEDRLAELDDALARSTAPPLSIDVMELWRERVELQGALINLHVAPVSSRSF